MSKVGIGRDVFSGIGLLVLSVVYYIGSRGLPAGQNEPGPRFFPALLSALLFVLAVIIILRGFRQTPREKRRTPLALIALTALYAVGFAVIGFVASTLLYTISATLLMGRRGKWAIVIPSGTTLAIWLLLHLGLGAPLP